MVQISRCNYDTIFYFELVSGTPGTESDSIWTWSEGRNRFYCSVIAELGRRQVFLLQIFRPGHIYYIYYCIKLTGPKNYKFSADRTKI